MINEKFGTYTHGFSQIEIPELTFSQTVFCPKARKPEIFFSDGNIVPEIKKVKNLKILL